MKTRYPLEHYYRIIYLFHTLEDASAGNISKTLKYPIGYVNKSINKHIKQKFPLLVLARETKSIESFVSICLESDNN